MTTDNTKEEIPTFLTKYFSSSDEVCKFINDERQNGKTINIISIIPLGNGSAYRLFYETYL